MESSFCLTENCTLLSYELLEVRFKLEQSQWRAPAAIRQHGNTLGWERGEHPSPPRKASESRALVEGKSIMRDRLDPRSLNLSLVPRRPSPIHWDVGTRIEKPVCTRRLGQLLLSIKQIMSFLKILFSCYLQVFGVQNILAAGCGRSSLEDAACATTLTPPAGAPRYAFHL